MRKPPHYSWYVKVVDEFTEVSSTDTLHFLWDGIGDVKNNGSSPTQVSLKQNYPNPFNPMTKIEFILANATDVTLKLYDLEGKEIATLLRHQYLGVGVHDVVFNATNISSGVYFYELITPQFTRTKKMVVNK